MRFQIFKVGRKSSLFTIIIWVRFTNNSHLNSCFDYIGFRAVSCGIIFICLNLIMTSAQVFRSVSTANESSFNDCHYLTIY